MKKKPARLKDQRHIRRKKHVRKKVEGTADRPRVTVTRSLKHMYVQFIDDVNGNTLVAEGTQGKETQGGGNCQAAAALGKSLAEKAKDKGINTLVFDRNGYKFHGRVKALADSMRENGLKF